MPVSLADVARAAAVSVATASRVTSGSTYSVSANTRARVEQAVRELGYSGNALARALVTGRTGAIGIIVGAVTDPFFAEITSGVETYARRAGHLTYLCSADRNTSVELAYLRSLRRQHAAGVILAGGVFAESPDAQELRTEALETARDGMHVVAVGERDLPGIPLVAVDDRAMLHDLTAYIASLGHRRIVFVPAPPGFTTGQLRQEGYERGMRCAGLEPELVGAGGFDYASGQRAAMRIAHRPLPDAVIAFNDESALGILLALREAGIRVPEDVSVAGVDDTRDAQFIGLTTVSVPMFELGATAARRITGEVSGAEMRTVLPHRLAPRGTTTRRGH